VAFNSIGGFRRIGTGTFKVDGMSSRTRRWIVRFRSCGDGTRDIGAGTGTPADDRDYQVPFPFTGKIKKLTLSLEPPPRQDAN
jgi:arylsulfatase